MKSTRMLSALLAMLTVGPLLLRPADASAQTPLTYTTSWIGNTFGFGDGKWVQQDIEAIAVAADGTVYANAPWDESGAEVSAYRGGDRVAVAGWTHGWGDKGGDAIAVNGTYLYAAMSISNENGLLVGADYPPKGQTWYGATRRPLASIEIGAPFASGIGNSWNPTKNSFLRVNVSPTGVDGSVRGIAATDKELYVANTASNLIVVYDANTMRQLRSWRANQPGRIAVDADGSLWVIEGYTTAAARAITHYTASGGALPSLVALPQGVLPADLAISPSGQLLIADSGPSQQIYVYAKPAGVPVLSSILGTRSGIFHAVKGTPGDWRFNGPTGIGFDRGGNLYVSQNGFGPRAPGSMLTGEGAVLESYAYASQALNWRLYGLLFVDGGSIDPDEPSQVFTGSKRFAIDYTKPPGQDWRYAAFTLDRFGYPDDPAFHLPKGVRGEPMLRRVGGRRLLYAIDMYSHYLSIYRFDTATQGQIAIPAGLLSQNPIPGAWPVGQPAYGEWMWRDTNGDGKVDASEIVANPSSGDTMQNGFWWVDSAGDVWLGSLVSGIRRLPFQGFDAHGNPIYDYASAQMFAMPAPFDRIARVSYQPDSDTMYVAGFTPALPYDPAHWKEQGRVLARYDNWRSGAPELRYAIMLPWDMSANPQRATVGFAVAGNYMFVVELYTAKIDVYDARTGALVGYMTPGADVGGTSGWVDVTLGISAFLRPGGEYVVLVEDDARAKLLMYRWTP
ncbi:hypothetical protein WS70_20660 [Burkholderia mayonis]|uniref:BceP n=2 Tax=Burkholderia mayonis TaxID=1385591 RepID=A0A1B4FKT3_9BURK|nr:hypothetical protein [Burkholderia mayonis]AOJ04269.1 hypothetical protein WS70_20660 [Burkholderia mayonis]KVE43759.1 hypothetical protein WS70_08925 [Burkholderia mayonis]